MQTAPWQMVDQYGFPLVRVAARLSGRPGPAARRLAARIVRGLKKVPAAPGAGGLAGLTRLEGHEREWGAHVTAMIRLVTLRETVEGALRKDPALADLLPLLEPPSPLRWDDWEDDELREICLYL